MIDASAKWSAPASSITICGFEVHRKFDLGLISFFTIARENERRTLVAKGPTVYSDRMGRIVRDPVKGGGEKLTDF